MSRVKVSDYLVRRLAELGTGQVFMVTGGGAMHLNDSVGRCPGLAYLCNHHEQACAMGAEGYARVSGRPGVVVVTSGPGGTNALTGVIGQWLDSVPVVYLSGQVKFETTIESCRELGLRQLGDQEINITDIVRPVTKFAHFLRDPLDARWALEKAWHLATQGRPGPVWIDIPLDVQAAMVEEEALRPFAAGDALPSPLLPPPGAVEETAARLLAARAPLLVAGHGVRIAEAGQELLALAQRLGVPVAATFGGFDLVPSDHPLFAGRIGTVGNRAGNFALQSADLLLSVGSRNNIRQVSYDWERYAPRAFKVMVDVDPAELAKPTVRPDLPVNADAGAFIRALADALRGERLPDWSGWRTWCRERRERYPAVLPRMRDSRERVNPYHFIDLLTSLLPEDAVVVAGNGTACVTLFQAGRVKAGQRMFWNSGCASMGYDLPAAIGAALAGGGRQVVCLAGDGSLMMNLQELQTVAHHRLPLKIFVLSNAGYVSIRQTQDAFFGGRYTGCHPASGVSFPDFARTARSFGLPASALSSHRGLEKRIREALRRKGPLLVEVALQPDCNFEPKLSSRRMPDGSLVSKPLEDMFPFLPPEEVAANLYREGLGAVGIGASPHKPDKEGPR